MKLAEALSIVQKAPAKSLEYPVMLACGFTPLHFKDYFAAHLQKALPNRKVRVLTGLYDDLPGTLAQFARGEAQACALAIEWSDLDARLGYRSLGGWGHRVVSSIIQSAKASLGRIEATIGTIPASSKLAVSLPTLPLPPGFHTTGWQASPAELALEQAVAEFASRIAARLPVLLVNEQRLDVLSPPHLRYDFRSDLYAGFPYTMTHADALGAALAALIEAPQPKKGLITDLDDTLWAGLVGEDGHENVSWDLATHSQLHGLYQQMLHALADQGVLIAIASKNSPEVAERALSRADLAIARDKIFPTEVHWESKSGSVERILKAWNIGADSVVFVDDSSMELEEVRAAHPEIECILFPKTDYAAGLALLHRLRDLFGKPGVSEEDAYRLTSLRRQFERVPEANGAGDLADEFLAAAEAAITLEYNPPSTDTRVVELVNKTNQFNLNGERYTAAEWHQALKEPGSFALVVSYRDKFGPLGKIAVIRGKQDGLCVHIKTWVMSCRAFSRRIEHQCIAQLFRRFGVEELVLHFKVTPRNGPIRDFLSSLLGQSPATEARLRREIFEENCPKLYHAVVEGNG